MDNALVSALINRFKEPSTYAGLAAFAALLGASTAQWDSYVAAAAGIASFISVILAIILPERKE